MQPSYGAFLYPPIQNTFRERHLSVSIHEKKLVEKLEVSLQAVFVRKKRWIKIRDVL